MLKCLCREPLIQWPNWFVMLPEHLYPELIHQDINHHSNLHSNQHNVWQHTAKCPSQPSANQKQLRRHDNKTAVVLPLLMDKDCQRTVHTNNNTKHTMPINQTDSICVSPSIIGLHNTHHAHSADDPDLLEVLSLFEGASTDDYDRDFDASVSTNSSLSAKSSSGGDDTTDACTILPQLARNRPATTHSLQHINTASSTKSLNYSSTNTIKSVGRNSPLTAYNRHEFGSTENGLPHSRQFGLPLNSDTFTNIAELPSPSSASLHSANGQIAMQELATKSSSAPILLKKEKTLDQFSRQLLVSSYS